MKINRKKRGRNFRILIIGLIYWAITGAACDTFLKAKGTISLNQSLSEQFAGKKLIGVWAIEARDQSEHTTMPGGEICESLGFTCSVVLQGIDVSFVLQGEDEAPLLNPDSQDVIISGRLDYPFTLSNIYGPGEKQRFARNYIGAFIDVDGSGQWKTVEPLGWAIENPLSRSCVNRRHSNHVNCLNLAIAIQ